MIDDVSELQDRLAAIESDEGYETRFCGATRSSSGDVRSRDMSTTRETGSDDSQSRPNATSTCSSINLGRIDIGAFQSFLERSGGWSSGDCNRGGHYVDLYRVHLAARGEVTIELTSNTDTFLRLVDDDGDLIDSDDDGGTDTNSRIRRTLAAGTYMVEATTYGAGETGSYELRIGVDQSGSAGATTEQSATCNSRLHDFFRGPVLAAVGQIAGLAHELRDDLITVRDGGSQLISHGSFLRYLVLSEEGAAATRVGENALALGIEAESIGHSLLEANSVSDRMYTTISAFYSWANAFARNEDFPNCSTP